MTPRLIELILKFRRTIKDDRKKDDTLYTVSDMDEGVGDVNSGQLTNQEIADLATEAINNFISRTVMQKAQIIMSRRQVSYSFEELAITFPEYTKVVSNPINLGTVHNLYNIPDDYIFFVSAQGNHLGSNLEAYRYITPYMEDRLKDVAFGEERASPYLIIYSNGGRLSWRTFRPAYASSSASSGTINFTYIAKQKDAQVDVEEVLINSFYDSYIVQEMVRLFENRQQMTE